MTKSTTAQSVEGVGFGANPAFVGCADRAASHLASPGERTVAALFIETGGCYANLPGVDPGYSA